MRKLMLAALVSIALLTPAAAQEGICITREAMLARAATLEMKTFYTLHGVDIGDEDKAEVVIFEVDEGTLPYVAVAFEGGCYAGLTQMDQAQVEQFINENTKKADGA